MDNNTFKTYEYESEYGGKYTVAPYLNTYVDYDNIYLGLYCYDDELKGWEPFCSVTVNIYDLPYLYGAIDTNNNGNKIVDFLEQNGFGIDTCLKAYSGYCEYPIFKFDEEKLREIDPEVFSAYASIHGKGKQPLQEKISDATARGTQHQSPLTHDTPER